MRRLPIIVTALLGASALLGGCYSHERVVERRYEYSSDGKVQREVVVVEPAPPVIEVVPVYAPYWYGGFWYEGRGYYHGHHGRWR